MKEAILVMAGNVRCADVRKIEIVEVWEGWRWVIEIDVLGYLGKFGLEEATDLSMLEVVGFGLFLGVGTVDLVSVLWISLLVDDKVRRDEGEAAHATYSLQNETCSSRIRSMQ